MTKFANVSRVGTAAFAWALLLGWMLACSSGRDTGTTPATKDAEGRTAEAAKAPDAPLPIVDAGDLVAAYDANEIAGDQKYKGKEFVIIGVVQSVGKDIIGTPYVTLSGNGGESYKTVHASFPRNSDTILATLAKGDKIHMRCHVRGKLMGPLADECAVVK